MREAIREELAEMLPEIVVMAVKKSLQLQESKTRQPRRQQVRQPQHPRQPARNYSNNPALNSVLQQTAGRRAMAPQYNEVHDYGVDSHDLNNVMVEDGNFNYENEAGMEMMNPNQMQPMPQVQMKPNQVMTEQAMISQEDADAAYYDAADSGVPIGDKNIPPQFSFLNRNYSKALKDAEEKVNRTRPME